MYLFLGRQTMVDIRMLILMCYDCLTYSRQQNYLSTCGNIFLWFDSQFLTFNAFCKQYRA